MENRIVSSPKSLSIHLKLSPNLGFLMDHIYSAIGRNFLSP